MLFFLKLRDPKDAMRFGDDALFQAALRLPNDSFCQVKVSDRLK